MNWESFKAFLEHLQPETIARILVDLENAHEDWEYYPEEAPAETIRKFLDEAVAVIISAGDKRAREEDADFRQIIERTRDEQDREDWAAQRDQQEVKNWLDDYK